MSFFRIVDRDGEMLADADSLDGVTKVVRRRSARALPCRRDFRGPPPIWPHLTTLGICHSP